MEIKNSSKSPLVVALISSLLSIGVHSYLAFNHFKIKFGLSDGKSLCNIGEKLNCDTVAASPYSALMNVPMAIWGTSTHIIFSFLMILVLINLLQDRKLVIRISFLLSLFISLVSVVMGTISLTLIGNFCLFCIATYALSFVMTGSLFVFDRTVLSESLQSLTKDIGQIFTGYKWILISLLLIPAFSFLGNRMILDSFGATNLQPMIEDSISSWKNSPKNEFNENLGLTLQKSSSKPKLVLVEFADFLCPHCKTASPTLHTFTESRPDVKLIFKPFPLDGTCNPAITQKGDGVRCKLAYAVYCANKISNKGWQAHDYIFERQRLWNSGQIDADLKDLAQKLEIPADQFEPCLVSNETFQATQTMAKEGEQARIQGTPSIFANGQSLERGQFMPVLEEAYKQ